MTERNLLLLAGILILACVLAVLLFARSLRRFLLAAIAILTAGALLAGFAAWTVVTPRAGEVRSAGEVHVPSVLGHEADEETLFYPWSLYNTERLTTPTVPEMIDMLELDPSLLEHDPEQPVSENSLLQPFRILSSDLEYDLDDLLSRFEWNVADSETRTNPVHLYLNQAPASLAASETPVTLTMGISSGSRIAGSWLIRPATPADLTEEDRAHALEKVMADFESLLLLHGEPDTWNLSELLQELSSYEETVSLFLDDCRFFLKSRYERDFSEPAKGGMSNDDILNSIGITRDDLFQQFESWYGWSIQFISTRQQVLVLVSRDNTTIGAYYDIQLETYSGLGIQE